VRGRIALHLDLGLGWTKPVVVASCHTCGTELARHPNQDRAIRAAGPATDLALVGGRQGPPGREGRPLRPVPHQGLGGGARTRNRPWTDAPPTANPTLGRR
jgi:hypothetical protein